jgi:aconitase A
LWGKVQNEGPLHFWAEITYSYYVEEYRSGTYLRLFRREEDADEFIRQIKDKQLQIRYKESDPETSTILDRDLEMIVPVILQTR